MMGFALPPGTVVATQAWSMHREEDVFPSAETFLPERWLIDPSADVESEEERYAVRNQSRTTQWNRPVYELSKTRMGTLGYEVVNILHLDGKAGRRTRRACMMSASQQIYSRS